MTRSTKHRGLAVLAAIVGIQIGFLPVARGNVWNIGDVFVGVASGSYQVYDNTGVFKESINDGSGGFTTGCAFDPSLTKLYTTNFSSSTVVVYDDAHPHGILQTITTGTQGNAASANAESVVFAASGEFYVGHAGGDADIHRYDAAGVFQQQYNVAIENRGSDWVDLAADQQTMFYTSEGGIVFRYDLVGDVQLPDFANIGGISYALRLLPPGDGSGGLLVANTGDIKRLDGSGAVVQTYDVAGEDCWFALNLDPNGTSFWSGDFCTANFYRFDIATGAIEVGPINTGTGTLTLFGICVKGEPTAGVPTECVRSQGYWKTHPGDWPVDNLTLGTVNYTQEELIRILKQPVRGNGLVSLAKQLIAAKLNQANGALVPQEVQDAIDAADALIDGLVVPPIGDGYLPPSETNELKDILDDYNTGSFPDGPEECDDVDAV